MSISPADLRNAALAAYADLKKCFSNPHAENTFWRCGHSFDSVVDYFTYVDASDANNFAPHALGQYAPQPQDWWDDYGWWGIAGLKAASAGVFTSAYVAKFRTEIISAAWKKMADNAPYGWQRADQQKFADWAPLIDGGVWNHVVDDQFHPGGKDQLGGRQNTVTNGLYLVLAQRLALAGELPPSIAAGKEYQFLKNWFDPPATLRVTPEYALMNNYAKGKAVVRERVSEFKPTTNKGNHYVDPAFRSELAWAGDQGLILGGLVDRMRIVGKTSLEYPVLLAMARKLIAGTKDYLAPSISNPPGVLCPWWPFTDAPHQGAPGDDQNDYWTGPAVYMRYLLNAFQNEDLRNDILKPDYQSFIRANAQCVLDSPDRPQTFCPVDRVVDQTNNLAILVAAIVMLAAVT